MPARELELGSAKIERQGELASLAREVIGEFAEIGREGWLGLMQLSLLRIQALHPAFEFQSHQALCGSSEEEWPDRRRRPEVEQSIHLALEDNTTFGSKSMLRGSAPFPSKKPSRFHGRASRGGITAATATISAVRPGPASVCRQSKQAAPDCSSGV